VYNTKEKKQSYQKAYQERNKERLLVYSKEYRITHKDEISAQKKEYGLKNKEKRKAYNQSRREIQKEFRRKNRLCTIINGKRVVVKCNKRPYPDNCEMCQKKVNRLGYHHWDDNKPEQGIWICYPCHIVAECVEKGTTDIISKYLQLKKDMMFSRIK